MTHSVSISGPTPAFEPGGYGRLAPFPGPDEDGLDLSEPWPEDEIRFPASDRPDVQPELDAQVLVPAHMLAHYALAHWDGETREVLQVQPTSLPGQVQVHLLGVDVLDLSAEHPVGAVLPRAVRTRDLRENQTVIGPWQTPLTVSHLRVGDVVCFDLLGFEQVLSAAADPGEWVQLP